MNLEFLDKVYKEIFSGEVAYIVNSCRAIGAVILAYSLYKSVMKSFSSTGELISKEEGGFSPYMLVRSLVLFALIMFIPQILSSFDTICVAIENEALKGFKAEPLSFDLNILSFKPPSPDETLTSYLIRIMSKTLEILNPLTWLGGAMSYILLAILYVIDFMIYPVFLAERYFIMGLIKIFAPLMVALAIYDKTRDYIYTLFKMYAIYFLVIIPYLFASVFVKTLQSGLTKMLHDSPKGAVVMATVGSLFNIIIILLVIIVKIRLYKRSLPFMKELIK